MSAGAADRLHARRVETAMEGLALTIDNAERIDAKEDDLIRRIHVALHRLEALDQQEDETRREIAATFRELAGILDRDERQLRLGEVVG